MENLFARNYFYLWEFLLIHDNLQGSLLFVRIFFYLWSLIRILSSIFLFLLICELSERAILKCSHVLKPNFWGNNYFNVLIHECWLVRLLLYAFMAADYCSCCSMIFVKTFFVQKLLRRRKLFILWFFSIWNCFDNLMHYI